jgi:hypothetical protein
MRVLSTVPDNAVDIREAPVVTFKDIEDVAFRGSAMRVTAWVLLALGTLLLLLALAGAWRRRRSAAPRTRLLPDAAILQGVRRELESIREQSRGGWTSDLAGRALAALRIIGAYAAGRPVAQKVRRARSLDRATTAPLDGQLAVNGRFGTSALIWAAVTAQHADEELKEALARLAAARYGRDGKFDAKLDDSLDAGIRVADRLISNRPTWERLWPR